MSDPLRKEPEIEALLRSRPDTELPPSLASGRLWREIGARRQPRTVPVLCSIPADVGALLGLAWTAVER